MKKNLFLFAFAACLCQMAKAQDCTPVSPPYVFDFETALPPALPDCSAVINAGSGNIWQTATSPDEGFEGNVLAYGAATEDANAWYFTKGIQLEAGTLYSLSYKYGNDGSSTENLAVFLATAVNESTATVQIGTQEGITGGASTDFTTPGPVSVSESGVYYIAVHAYSGANQGNLYIDDISVDMWDCETPEGLNITDITTTTATLNWNAVTSGNLVQFYQISVQEGNGAPAEGPTTTNLSAPTYFALTPATSYTAYVRSFCSGVWSDWAEGVRFTTPICDSSATIPYNQDFESVTAPDIPECNLAIAGETGSNWVTVANPGNGFTNNALAYTGNSEAADAWYFTQGITLEAGSYYNISYTYGNDGSSSESFTSYLASAPAAQYATSTISAHTGVTGGEAVNFQFPNAVSVEETGVYYIAFHITSEANQGNLYLDNISMTEWTCNEPGEATVTDITTSGATISWTAPEGSNPIGYFYAISTTEEVPVDFVMTTDLSITFDNLDPATTYYFYIKSFCGPVIGDASEPVIFTTEAGAGIGAYTFKSLQVYPNPAQNMLYIRNNDVIDTAVLYNITGQEIFNYAIGNTTADINIEKLPAGIYMLQISSEGAIKTLKVIKE